MAHDGREGVDKAKSDHFDLIFMDISMPVMDGRVATREIRKGNGRSAQSPIVALTANAMVDEQTNFEADGMNGVLTKPLSRTSLRETLAIHQFGTGPAEQPAFAIAHVRETRDALGEEAFAKLRMRFMDEVDDLLDWLHSDVPQDFLEVANRAHKVAGSAAVFGAIGLRETLKNIETAAKAGNNRQISQHLRELDPVWSRTKTALLTGN
jgi:CheY-like chemotaxis protein